MSVNGDGHSLEKLKIALGRRTLVLVGLMGCGKSSVGKRLAGRLGLQFVDADDEIVRAAGQSINEIFAEHGEAYFRDGERKVIARILAGGPQVLATGGGAFMNPETRAAIRDKGLSIWLRADLPVLMKRVMKRDNRPLLKTGDPEVVMRNLMETRYPIYAEADLVVESRDVPHDVIVSEILDALRSRLFAASSRSVVTEPTRSVASPTMSNTSARVDDPTAPPRIVDIALPGRAYDVLIGPGLLGEATRHISARLGNAKCAIVTDANVARLHLATLETGLRADGRLRGQAIVLPAGESTKSFGELGPLCEKLLETGLERGDLVIALGGGVIGDLAGFAASILRRGVRFVQIPTSLLAQVDSSVGGKTGINTRQGKNLIGTFHQPSLVLADTDVLATLPPREMRAGYAEVAKYGLLGDASFFEWLEANHSGIFAGERMPLTTAIETSVKAKAAIVIRDEHENGDRALLNLGHTFGHALEAWTGYSDRLLHGEGVAIGMCLAFRFSEELGLCPKGTAERVSRHIAAVGLPTRIAQIPGQNATGKADAGHLVRLMGQDKKVRNGRLTFILAHAVGKAFVARDIDDQKVSSFLSREIATG